MDLDEVLTVISALEQLGIRYWIAGGWGVDALVGWQTRAHRDVDLAIDGMDEARVSEALHGLGYAVETDQRPARLELAAPGQGWVDLHLVCFDQQGWGTQANLEGGCFRYPPAAFTFGVLGGHPVGCLSAGQQLEFRRGYRLRDVDHHDIALLRSQAGANDLEI